MKKNTRMLVEAGLMLALTFILSNIKLFSLPQGGSITLGGQVPLMIFALRWGVGPGILVGGTFGLLKFFMDPFILTPVQFILDYPLAYALLGISGFGRSEKALNGNITIGLILGVLLGGFGRLVSSTISGVVFFGEYLDPKLNPFIASMIVNGSVMVPNLIVTLVILLLIWRPVMKSTQIKTA